MCACPIIAKCDQAAEVDGTRSVHVQRYLSFPLKLLSKLGGDPPKLGKVLISQEAFTGGFGIYTVLA